MDRTIESAISRQIIQDDVDDFSDLEFEKMMELENTEEFSVFLGDL